MSEEVVWVAGDFDDNQKPTWKRVEGITGEILGYNEQKRTIRTIDGLWQVINEGELLKAVRIEGDVP